MDLTSFNEPERILLLLLQSIVQVWLDQISYGDALAVVGAVTRQHVDQFEIGGNSVFVRVRSLTGNLVDF